MFNAVIDAPFGKLGVRTDASVVREILYLPESVRSVAPNTTLAKRAVRQIERYFDRASARFDLPLAPVGTAFQRRVWNAISEIPPGLVSTYGQIAKQIGTGPRAVGQACGANYFPLVIPCHRVVASGGIGGFANGDTEGYYLRVKRWLLAHEGVPYR
ncbi:methylated-DNA--[protein]-cysteine S-methyltransferase [Burkholderia alba]|uniref:methylated-DNA--[protein]-cysteine S-methyltransferase n=1 Tax=Burkholderia alba TaxID=2683677 RepID=UPI002B052EC5|nr:methylated-DNA--[protein]-cysteine S-methyltransferase [Burkholderia alba]